MAMPPVLLFMVFENHWYEVTLVQVYVKAVTAVPPMEAELKFGRLVLDTAIFPITVIVPVAFTVPHPPCKGIV